MNVTRIAALGAILALGGAGAGCYRGPAPETNPAAAGFDAAGSDPAAIELADQVMDALGGRARWDATRVIAWNAFGLRRLMWDKHAQKARIQYLDGPALDVAVDLATRSGRAWRGDVEVTDPAELQALLEAAYRHWLDDSRWLVLPYRLKDAGVTLRSLGEARLGSRTCDALELTCAGVGATVQQRYVLLVSRDRRLVEHWSGFERAADSAPTFATIWSDWRFYGGIQLSGDRGERKLTEISVLDEPPPGMLDRPRGA